MTDGNQEVKEWQWHAIGGRRRGGAELEQPLASASERTAVTRRRIGLLCLTLH